MRMRRKRQRSSTPQANLTSLSIKAHSIEVLPDTRWRNSPTSAGIRRRSIKAENPALCSGGVSAVIFSDGSSEGDIDDVNELYERRRGVFTVLGPIIEILNGIVSQKENRDQAITATEQI